MRNVKKQKSSKHNGLISIWKFLFAILILVHHCCKNFASDTKVILFLKGSIGVEFFFLVSGYLLAKKVYQEGTKDKRPIYQATWEFLWKKMKSFFPYLLFSFVCLVGIDIFLYHRLSPTRYLMGLSSLTLLNQAGISEVEYNPGVWYLSALILSMLLIYPLMKKYQKKFSCFIAPMIVIFLGGFLLHENGHLRDPRSWFIFSYEGLVRAIVEVSLGCIIYEVTSCFQKLQFTKLGSILLSVLCFFCLGFVYVMNIIYEKATRLDWLSLILLAVGVGLAFSEKTFFCEKCNNKIFYYLEKLSLPIYLNNYIFIWILNSSWGLSTFSISFVQKVLLAAALTILLSIIELFLMKYIMKVFDKGKELCKKYLLA